MKICLLTESTDNPVLGAALDDLAERHTVLVQDPAALSAKPFHQRPAWLHDVDVYLLKSRSPGARTFARAAEQSGSLVLNSPRATSCALDRTTMTALLRAAGVAIPRTWTFASLTRLSRQLTEPPWPVVVKSRISRRGDLVSYLGSAAELAALLPRWAGEPGIVQEFIPNDGFDLKFWVIGQDVSVARRPAALEARDTGHDRWIDPAALPAGWIDLVLRAGAALGLELFGADLILGADGPVVIDVNAFPGFRGAPSAADTFSAFVEHRATEWRLCA